MSEAHKRWHAVLAELKAIGKDSVNQQQRFQYRSIDDIKNHLNPLLSRHGVFYYPSLTERVSTEQRQTKSGGVQFAVSITQWYTVAAEDGSYFEVSVPAEATDFGDKATQKAMTFAEKTFLAQSLCIPTNDIDPDGESPEPSVARNWVELYNRAYDQGTDKLTDFLAWARTQGDAPQEMLTAGAKALAGLQEGNNHE
ncbi:ERF family protein [Rothia nasimurium]|nr:ERF family protein [Rothia nasimurium]MBF0808845.1 ERF family protein [Rothia nasimurium]